jgi:hypothetical protein
MLLKPKTKTRGCDIRSECKAKWNRRYYNRLLSKEWDHLVIKLDARSGRYRMELV